MDVSTKHGGSTLADARRRLRVLIVDDDRDFVQILMVLLKDQGHEPHGVYAGRYVVGSVIDVEPDVVVLNTNMPDMTGSSAAHTIKSLRGSDGPVLIGISGISGHYQSLAEKALARPVGFKYYLEKPFVHEELLALLDNLRYRVASF